MPIRPDLLKKSQDIGESIEAEDGLSIIVLVTDIHTGQTGWVSSAPGHDAVNVMAEVLTGVLKNRAS